MEYWDCRPYSSGEQNAGAYQNNCLPDGVYARLGNLFKKANSQELHSLHSILSDERPPMGIDLVARLLNEEMHSRG